MRPAAVSTSASPSTAVGILLPGSAIAWLCSSSGRSEPVTTGSRRASASSPGDHTCGRGCPLWDLLNLNVMNRQPRAPRSSRLAQNAQSRLRRHVAPRAAWSRTCRTLPRGHLPTCRRYGAVRCRESARSDRDGRSQATRDALIRDHAFAHRKLRFRTLRGSKP